MKVTIYFAGAIRGGREDQKTYFAIIEMLQQHHTVLCEHVGSAELSSFGETTLSNEQIRERDMEWIRQSDIVVAECSSPSLGVGYEIRDAEQLEKPIIALYRRQEGRRLSAMIAGSPSVTVLEYDKLDDLSELPALIQKIFT